MSSLEEAKDGRTVKQKVRGLLLLLGGSALSAFLLAAYMVYFWGPSSEFTVRNILLSPKVLEELNYQEPTSISGHLQKMRFAGIEYHQLHQGYWQKHTAEIGQYQRIWKTIQNDRSLPADAEAVSLSFLRGPTARLVLLVQPVSGGEKSSFQELQVDATAGLYRIQLHEDASTIEWIYFKNADLIPYLQSLFPLL